MAVDQIRLAAIFTSLLVASGVPLRHDRWPLIASRSARPALAERADERERSAAAMAPSK